MEMIGLTKYAADLTYRAAEKKISETDIFMRTVIADEFDIRSAVYVVT